MLAVRSFARLSQEHRRTKFCERLRNNRRRRHPGRIARDLSLEDIDRRARRTELAAQGFRRAMTPERVPVVASVISSSRARLLRSH